MGFKNIKDHFNIDDHTVAITEKGISIGAGYIKHLVDINVTTGEVVENPTFRGFLKDKYPLLAAATPEEILRLINSSDMFEVSLPAYTFNGSEIIEKQCEAFGYPNVTHDGEQMYNNTFFEDKEQAIEKAICEAEMGVEYYNDSIDRLLAEIEVAKKDLEVSQNDLTKLKEMEIN